MTIAGLGLKVIAKFPMLKKRAQRFCKRILSDPDKRRKLNKWYNRLSITERHYFHHIFSQIFRNSASPVINDHWKVQFMQSVINMPLRSENLWLDWDLAVSIVGHDMEIKSFYEKLVTITGDKNCFFDVGANYGTHSILFLSQGIQTITFEPNPECRPMFEAMLQANGLTARLENFAVGETNAHANLVFPKNDTWNGSIESDFQEKLPDHGDLKTIDVEIIRLDDFTAQENLYPSLIKIDTEGFELNVLRGARQTLATAHPWVVFESNYSNGRTELFNELARQGYSIYNIENTAFNSNNFLNEADFVASSQTNFAASHPLSVQLS